MAVYFQLLVTWSLARASTRLISTHEHHIHPKHYAAKLRVSNEYYAYDEYEMDPLQLGDHVDHSTDNWVTLSGPRKHSRMRSSCKPLAAWAHSNEVDVDTTAIDNTDTECRNKCNTLHGTDNDDFKIWAECYASCWYVADGKMASVSIMEFRNKYKPGAFTYPENNERNYKHYMRYLFNALHREHRFDVIKTLYDAQRAEAGSDEGFIGHLKPFDLPLRPTADNIYPALLRQIKSLFTQRAKDNKLFVWRGLHGMRIPETITDETDVILHGPTSTTLSLRTAKQAADLFKSSFGTILRIEIPVNPLEGGNENRCGKSVAWFEENFGLIDMYGTDYANAAHKAQRELLLYDVCKDWIHVEMHVGKEVASRRHK